MPIHVRHIRMPLKAHTGMQMRAFNLSPSCQPVSAGCAAHATCGHGHRHMHPLWPTCYKDEASRQVPPAASPSGALVIVCPPAGGRFSRTLL